MERFRLPLVDSLSHAGMDVYSKRLSATTFSPTRWTNAGAAFSLAGVALHFTNETTKKPEQRETWQLVIVTSTSTDNFLAHLRR